MEHYAGIDVSLEQSSVCVVDVQGKIVKEAKVGSEPEALHSSGFVQADQGQNVTVGNATMMLNFESFVWSGRWDSNPRPQPWQGHRPLAIVRNISSH
jgi:hypothetical protein